MTPIATPPSGATQPPPAAQPSPAAQRSLVRRALLAIVLTELLCMLALTGVSLWHEHRARLRAVDVLVEGRADSLFGAIQDAEDTGDNVTLESRELALPPEDAFAVYDATGRRLGASTGAPDALIDRPFQTGWSTTRVGHHRYRVLRRTALRIIDRAENSGIGLERPVEIVYAMRIDRLWNDVFSGVRFFLGASLLLLACTMAVMLALVRVLLRPIAELASAAAAVSARTPRFVAPEAALRTAELAPLAVALTAMVGGLRDSIDRQHRFLGDSAHELKTAVAVVRSTLELMQLRRQHTAVDIDAGLQQAVHDNERVEDLISRMLLLARLEEASPSHPPRADLHAVAALSLALLAPVAERAGVQLVAHWPPPPSRLLVAAPPPDLQILLSNLLLNAIQHSEIGASVTLDLAQIDQNATLTITDTGSGIPEAALPHIFERFFRTDTSRARSTGGAGLGLAIAKAITTAAGGTIAAASQPGAGTRMLVTLPLLVSSVADEPTAQASDLPSNASFRLA